MENTTAGIYRHIQNCISNSFKRRFVSLFSLLARGERCYLWQRWWKKCKGPSLWVSYSVLAVWNKNVLYRRCVCVCVWVILLHMLLRFTVAKVSCVVISFDCLNTEINQAFIYDFFHMRYDLFSSHKIFFHTSYQSTRTQTRVQIHKLFFYEHTLKPIYSFSPFSISVSFILSPVRCDLAMQSVENNFSSDSNEKFIYFWYINNIMCCLYHIRFNFLESKD